MSSRASERPAAVLVAVQLNTVSDEDHEADLAELGRLVHTLGYDVVGRVSQRRSSVSKGAVLGQGKLAALAELTGGPGPSGMKFRRPGTKRDDEAEDEAPESAEFADEDEEEGDIGADAGGRTIALVVVDHDLTPSQLRNLEKVTGTDVLDRSGVIIEIFHRHAKSREAKAEVEIARLNYVAPRLRETGGSERQRGRGAGESQLELDRRKIRDRIAELRKEIDGIQREQATRRALRQDQRRVALVGYTNAGKSSLMRALTGSDVYVMDKLFATLDTTVRALHPEVKPRILVSDTVGFIKKLPHDLVASFRSTLDEALEASLLLYVTDASDPTFRSQLDVTRATLTEIGAAEVPYKLVLNKIDRVDEATRLLLSHEFPEAILLSAKDSADVAKMRQIIIDYFDALMVPGELVVPYAKQALVSEVYEHAKVLSETYDELGAHLDIRAEPAALARLQSLVERDS